MQTFGGFPRRELSALRLLPPGGASGQILKKTSVTDYDAKWENESGGAAVIQPGEVVLGPWTSAPLGLVTLNGALLSRTTYAQLWSFAQTYGKLVSDATWSAGAYGAFSTATDRRLSASRPQWLLHPRCLRRGDLHDRYLRR